MPRNATADVVNSATGKPSASPVINHSIPVPVSKLHHHPGNIRQSHGELDGMAVSMRAVGILQPLLVIPHPDLPGEYYVIDGDRRVTAARRAGLTDVPVIVRQAAPDSAEVIEMMLVSVFHRAGLDPVEKARAIGRLRDERGKTQAQIAKATGISQSAVSWHL